ncbi:MAG: hypothetical protein JJ902_11690 [Roseibium sp.]|nr:hypothetical protein [Roseibium sp.]
MTASVQNALRALKILEESLEAADLPRMLPLVDSVAKCLRSLAGQVAHYEEAAKGLRGLRVKFGDAAPQHVPDVTYQPFALEGHAMDATDVIVFGAPQAIARVAQLQAEAKAARAKPVPHQKEPAWTKVSTS